MGSSPVWGMPSSSLVHSDPPNNICLFQYWVFARWMFQLQTSQTSSESWLHPPGAASSRGLQSRQVPQAESRAPEGTRAPTLFYFHFCTIYSVKWKSLSRVRFFVGIGLYSPWNSPGQNIGVGSHSLLQGIFPTQGSNPGLLHCGQILYQLSHKGTVQYNFIKRQNFHRDSFFHSTNIYWMPSPCASPCSWLRWWRICLQCRRTGFVPWVRKIR